MIGALLSVEVTSLGFLSEFCVCSMNIEKKLPNGKMNCLFPCTDFSPFLKKYVLAGSQRQSFIVSFIFFQACGMFSYICQRSGTKSRYQSTYPLGWLSLSLVEHFKKIKYFSFYPHLTKSFNKVLPKPLKLVTV